MKLRFNSISPLGFFSLSAGYLAYDFYHHPTQAESVKVKKVFLVTDSMFGVKKFTSEELLEKELIVRDGRIYRKDSDAPLEGDGWIYVMNRDGKIYLERPMRRFINHHSLGSSHEVVAAGEIKFKEGKIYELNENSGHYRPRDRVKFIELRLQGLGAIFDAEYTCKRFESRPMIQLR